MRSSCDIQAFASRGGACTHCAWRMDLGPVLRLQRAFCLDVREVQGGWRGFAPAAARGDIAGTAGTCAAAGIARDGRHRHAPR
eukprot:355357-Chlamydomonas_euryale.AAC.1